MKKKLDFNNIETLKELIKKNIKLIDNKKNFTPINMPFVEDKILIKPIDYYYTNPIARSSKVMNECRQISKKFLFTGIEKAS